MEIFADRPEFAAEFFKESGDLLFDGPAARGEHFGDEEARENAVFFGNVAADGEARTFFTAHGDLVFTDELADVLEADGSLIRGLSVGFRGGVDHLRSGN